MGIYRAEVSISSEANPKVKFISEGTFTIILTAINSARSNTKTRTGYITVNAASVKADFVATSTSITEGGSVTFTDKSLDNSNSKISIPAGMMPLVTRLRVAASFGEIPEVCFYQAPVVLQEFFCKLYLSGIFTLKNGIYLIFRIFLISSGILSN